MFKDGNKTNKGGPTLDIGKRCKSQKPMKTTAFLMVGRMTSLWPTLLPYSKLGGARLIARVGAYNYKKNAGYIVMKMHTLHESALKTIVN